MAEDKELYGYEEEDILTLEFDDGVEEECGILGVFDALGSTTSNRGKWLLYVIETKNACGLT
mgnify:CR=1 FL=1